MPSSTAASGSGLDYADVECLFWETRPDEARVTIIPYLALGGTICIGVGAQTLFKIGATGAESITAQLLRVSTIAGRRIGLSHFQARVATFSRKRKYAHNGCCHALTLRPSGLPCR
jgi:hypothetical protein